MAGDAKVAHCRRCVRRRKKSLLPDAAYPGRDAVGGVLTDQRIAVEKPVAQEINPAAVYLEYLPVVLDFQVQFFLKLLLHIMLINCAKKVNLIFVQFKLL